MLRGIIGPFQNNITHGPDNGSWGSNLWATANKARYFFISVQETFDIRVFAWLNGGTVNGNVDAGLYDINFNLVVSTGSTAMAGASQVQKVTLGSVTSINPGGYYLAFASSSATNSFFVQNLANLNSAEQYNAFEQLTAFPLPATMAPVSQTANFFLPTVSMIANGYPFP